MAWRIRYIDKYSGKEATIEETSSQSEAEQWTKRLAESHGCKAVCVHINGDTATEVLNAVPGKVTHIINT